MMTRQHHRKRRAYRSNTWTHDRAMLAVAAKARKRLADPPPDLEPRMTPCYRYRIKIQDTLTGEVTSWYDLKSVRWLSQAIGAIVRTQ